MENATMLYRYPGQHEMHGDKYDYIVVDEADIEQHIAEGWFKTTPEAKEAHEAVQRAELEKQEAEADDNAAATHEEVAQKLTEMNIVFDRRLGLKKLQKLLDEALAAKA